MTRPPRVLVADDTPDVRHLLAVTLRLEGYDVVGEAEDGARAVELARELQPDLVTLDLAMPVMDGLQALPRIKEVAPASRVVVMSGFTAAQMGPEVRRRGADAYVEKGTPLDEVVRVLGALVPAQRPPSDPVPAARAHAAPEAESELVGVVVHELTGPIAVIAGFADTLRREAGRLSADDVRMAAERIHAGARRLEALVRGLGHAGGALPAREDLDLDVVDLGALVSETVADVRMLVPGHVLAVDAPVPVPATADPVRVAEVVANLCTNAAKFSPPGSVVRVGVRRDGEWAYVRVADQGPGVPDADAERIFAKFCRLDPAVPGTGLGLWVARAIARAHGGDVVLLRPPAAAPAGATFELRLPAAG